MVTNRSIVALVTWVIAVLCMVVAAIIERRRNLRRKKPAPGGGITWVCVLVSSMTLIILSITIFWGVL